MECPFCKQEMKAGQIPADRAPLTWRGGGEEIRLTRRPVLGEECADAYYCPDCKQILLPVPQIERFSDRVKKTVDKLTAGVKKEWEDREAARQEKQTERRRGKDPWER